MTRWRWPTSVVLTLLAAAACAAEPAPTPTTPTTSAPLPDLSYVLVRTGEKDLVSGWFRGTIGNEGVVCLSRPFLTECWKRPLHLPLPGKLEVPVGTSDYTCTDDNRCTYHGF